MKGGVSAADIEMRLHVPVRYRVPDDQPLATHSVNRGVPLLISHPRSAVGRAIRGLGRLLAADRAGEAAVALPATGATAGLFGWLRRSAASLGSGGSA
jgi:pilus assembly protein CpaE